MKHQDFWPRIITVLAAMIAIGGIATIEIIGGLQVMLDSALYRVVHNIPRRAQIKIAPSHPIPDIMLPEWTIHNAVMEHNQQTGVQGQTTLFEFISNTPYQCEEIAPSIRVYFTENTYNAFCYGEKIYTLVGIDVAQEPKNYELKFSIDRKEKAKRLIPIIENNFQHRNRGFSHIPELELAQREQERLERDTLIQKSWNTYEVAIDLNHGDFIYPLDNVYTTSPFGQHRVYLLLNPQMVSVIRIHKGADFRARTPKPVRAIFDGFVINTSYYLGWGNYTAVYHGHGIVTEMLHQSRIYEFVKPSTYVKAGKIIGETGNTGGNYVSHLHFQVSIYGAYVDPIQFIQLAKSITVQRNREIQIALSEEQ